jgi:hypothetical protein
MVDETRPLHSNFGCFRFQAFETNRKMSGIAILPQLRAPACALVSAWARKPCLLGRVLEGY